MMGKRASRSPFCPCILQVRTPRTTTESVGSIDVAAGYDLLLSPPPLTAATAAAGHVVEEEEPPDSPPDAGGDDGIASPNDYGRSVGKSMFSVMHD